MVPRRDGGIDQPIRIRKESHARRQWYAANAFQAASASACGKPSTMSLSWSAASIWGRWPQFSMVMSFESGNHVEHLVGAGLEHQHVLPAPHEQNRAVDLLRLDAVAQLGRPSLARSPGSAPPWRGRGNGRRSSWRRAGRPTRGGGTRAACRPRRPPSSPPAEGSAPARRGGCAGAARASMIEIQRARSRPAGATGMIPARSASGSSARRREMQPPSELPTRIAPPSGAKCATAARRKSPSWARIDSCRLSFEAVANPGRSTATARRSARPRRSRTIRHVSALSAKPWSSNSGGPSPSSSSARVSCPASSGDARTAAASLTAYASWGRLSRPSATATVPRGAAPARRRARRLRCATGRACRGRAGSRCRPPSSGGRR